MRRKREPWLHPVSGQHESNPAGTPAVTFHLLQKSRSEIENGKDDEGRNVWGKSSSQMSSRSVKTCLILESCVISFPLCLSLVTVNCLLKRECQKNLVYKKKKKKGTFSEMLDNSRGIVLWNLSHTLLKKKTKNTMTEFTSSRDLYYPKHSWSNSLHLLWTLYFFIFPHMHHPTEPEHIAPLSQHKLSSKEENRQVFENREKITSVDKNMKVNTELCVGIIDVLKGRCDIKWQKQNGDKQAACQWADGCDSLMSCSDVLNMLLSVNYIY